MIAGTYSSDLPRLVLRFRGPSSIRTIECIVDSGFDGHVALSSVEFFKLGITPAGIVFRRLTDGSVVDCRRYRLDVEWGSGWRTVDAIEMGNAGLVGTLMMSGGTLFVDMIEGGDVIIELPD